MTSGWNRGYVSDVPYVVGYQPTQTPPWLAAVCALMGVVWEPRERLVVGELGCGRGYTANVLAAANPDWHVVGLDYNPAHVAEARALAEEAQLPNAIFLEADLAEMGDAEADALPEFDVVTLHGLWSWVSDAVRAGILRVLRRRLRPGGLAMVSYNAMPGFMGGHPVQRLVRTAAALDPAGGDSVERVERAMDLARRLKAAGAAHLGEANRWAAIFLGAEQRPDPAYLAHEFLTDHWRPCFHADVSAAMAEAKLDYVGSARLVENFPELTLTPEQRALHDAMPEGPARELVKDLCLPRGFRSDVFIRGLRRAPREPMLDGLVMASLADKEEPKIAAETPLGEAALPAGSAEPILAALRSGPARVGELRRLAPSGKVGAAELAALLMAGGTALPVWRDEASAESAGAARRLNVVAARRYAANGYGQGVFALASSLLAAGLPCGPLDLEVAARLATGADWSAGTLARALAPPAASAEAVEEAERRIGALLEERSRPFRTHLRLESA